MTTKTLFPAICTNCGTKRKPSEPRFTEMQMALGMTPGWWSIPESEGQEAEELCGSCIHDIIQGKIGDQS